MASSLSEIDEQIERLRKGDTLAENEVKALCEKVSQPLCSGRPSKFPFLPELLARGIYLREGMQPSEWHVMAMVGYCRNEPLRNKLPLDSMTLFHIVLNFTNSPHL